MLDEEAFTVSTPDRRRLSRLPIESLIVAPVGTKMIILVDINDTHIQGRHGQLQTPSTILAVLR